MDIKTAIELIESGRIEEIDIDDLWEIINTLSSSAAPEAFQSLLKLQNSKIGQSLPQLNIQMQYIIEQNAQAVSKIENGFNLFALDKKGQPLHQEVMPIFNFFANIEVDNKEGSEKVNKEELFLQAAEIAKLTAKKDIYLNKNFSRLQPEDQKKTYVNTVLMAMEETAFVLVSNQILEEKFSDEKDRKSIEIESQIATKAEHEFNKIINPQSTTRFKLSNRNIISTFISEINRADRKAMLTQENTLSKELNQSVKEVDKQISKHYPETSRLLRPLAAYQYIGLISGKAGKNMYSADTIAETVHSYNPVKGRKDVSLFAFLREQPTKLKVFSRHIVISIKKAYNNIKESLAKNFSGEKFASGLMKMFMHFSNNKEKYNGVGIKTAQGNLRIVNADISRIINDKSSENKMIAWRNFGLALNKSQLGRAISGIEGKSVLNPEKAELVPEAFEDYTSVTMIDLNKKTKTNKMGNKTISPLKIISKAIMGNKSPQK